MVYWTLIAAALFLARTWWWGGEALDPDRLSDAVRAFGVWGPLALVALYSVRPLLLLPITPLWLASGFIFGWPGALLSMFGTSAGAAIGFYLSRRLGREFVERRFKVAVCRWTLEHPADSLRTVMSLQLMPFMPHDVINGVAGVSRMPYRSFFLGSLLGTLPIILVYTWIGSAVRDVFGRWLWAVLAGLTIVGAGSFLWVCVVARRRSSADG